MKIRTHEWMALTRRRLHKYNIESGYALNPMKWDNAIRFEVEQYGTSQKMRLYLMRRWQKRIMDLPADMLWNQIKLLEILSSSLLDKVNHHFKNPDLRYLKENHPYSLYGYMAKKPTRAILRYYSF